MMTEYLSQKACQYAVQFIWGDPKKKMSNRTR